MKRLGLIAYSTDTGLGNQTWEIYKNLVPTKTLLVDLSRFNLIKTNHERYVGARIAMGYPSTDDMNWLTDDVDTIIVCETPLNYELFALAKAKNVRVIHQYNYEFFDYFRRPELPRPSVFAAPSTWNTDIVAKMDLATVIELPVPVNREVFRFRKINECKVIAHIVGRPAVHDRNGTIQFLKAAEVLGDNFRYKLYLQPPTDARAIEYFEPVRQALEQASKKVRIEVFTNVENSADMYRSDLLVMPRKYGGLCLPMQEALSSGMPVVMTNISPNYNFLPSDWLAHADLEGSFMAHTTVEYYKASVESLIQKIVKFKDPLYMQKANGMANNLADKISWANLKIKYEELIDG